eukprot:Nk52_evm14s310 gene=Nk52_evmTU14s310
MEPIELNLRRTEHSDVEGINALIDTCAAGTLFGKQDLTQLIELSILSATATNAGHTDEEGVGQEEDIVGFAAFNDAPLEQNPGKWHSAMAESYDMTGIENHNTVFLHCFAVKPKHERIIGSEMFKTLFNTIPECDQIILSIPKDAEINQAIKDSFELLPELEKSEEATEENEKGSQAEKFYVCSRSKYTPNLLIRTAKVEDHDDLIPIFNRQTEVLTERYGDYFLAELIEAQNESNIALAAESDGKAIGFLSITKEVDVSNLKSVFDLEPFNNLMKNIAPPVVPSEETSEDPPGTALPGGQDGEAPQGEGETAEGEVNGENEDEEAELKKINTAPDPDREKPHDPRDVEPLPKSLRRRRSSVSKIGSVVALDSSGKDDDGIEEEHSTELKSAIDDFKSQIEVLPEASEESKSVGTTVAAPVEEWVENAFSICLFCMDEAYESRSMDFLEKAFECFPDKEYCVITIPFTTPSFPLLDRFVRIAPSVTATCPHELYVFHKYGLLKSFEVSKLESENGNGVDGETKAEIEGLISSMHGNGDYTPADCEIMSMDVLSDISISLKEPQIATFTARCEGILVGFAVVETADENTVDFFRANFNIEDFIVYDAHKNGGDISKNLKHSYLVHFVLNPIFCHQTRYFIREIMRICGQTCIYHQIFCNDVVNHSAYDYLSVCGSSLPSTAQSKTNVNDEVEHISLKAGSVDVLQAGSMCETQLELDSAVECVEENEEECAENEEDISHPADGDDSALEAAASEASGNGNLNDVLEGEEGDGSQDETGEQNQDFEDNSNAEQGELENHSSAYKKTNLINTSLLLDFIQVRRRRQPIYPQALNMNTSRINSFPPSLVTAAVSGEERDLSNQDEKLVNDMKEGNFVLNFMSKKLIHEPKITVNSRIVIIGASNAALSLMETLIYTSHLKFNNVTLISTSGTDNYYTERDCSEVEAKFLSSSHCFNPRELAQIGIENFVSVVRGKLVGIDRKAQELHVKEPSRPTASIAPYDILILAQGIQYIPEDQVKTSSPQPIPHNVVSINCLNDVRKAISLVEHTPVTDTNKIIVYGKSLEAYSAVSGLLAKGISGSRIVLVHSHMEGEESFALTRFHKKQQEHEKELREQEQIFKASKEPAPGKEDTESDEDVSLSSEEKRAEKRAMHYVQYENAILEDMPFSDPKVSAYVLAYLKENNVEILPDVSEIVDISVGDDGLASSIYFSKYDFNTKEVCSSDVCELDCQLVICLSEKTCDVDAFTAIDNACIVYDGRVVVNQFYQTNDCNIFAAGSCTKFARKYFVEDWDMCECSSLETGAKIAHSILQLVDPLSVPTPQPESLPKFFLPKVREMTLPGGVNYLSVECPSIPREKLPTLNELNCIRKISTSSGPNNLFEIEIDAYDSIKKIVCMNKDEIDSDNIISFWGLPQTYLNNLLDRFDEGLIKDMFEFFKASWATAIVHDRFYEFRQEMVTEALQGSSMDGIRERLNLILKEKGVADPSEKIQLRDDFYKTKAKTDIDKLLLDFLNYNSYHLSMYVRPEYHFKDGMAALEKP